MGVFSGKNVNAKWNDVDIPDVQSFEVNPSPGLLPYSSSDTGGGKKRVVGVEDVTASVTCLVHGSGSPLHGLLDIGDAGTVKLIEDDTNAGETTHILVAKVADISVGVDGDSGAIVSCTVNFERDGTYTKPS